MKNNHGFLRDEEGFTTVGAVIALLLTLSLIFSAAQVYRLSSVASEVQNVADACALAAENEVAEFMIIVRVCDAVVLSLSLTSLAATGLGVAALCTPLTAPASEILLKAGHDIAHARDEFAEKAADGLNRLQRALPFMAAVNAASVAAANNRDASNYLALALLAPSKGDEISIGPDKNTGDLQNEVDKDADDIKRAAKEAEEAAERANEAKQRGFERDCGDNPSYCMYERASSLAALAGFENPLYASVDTWSFSVALKRAQAYYPARLAQESPADNSVDECARSALRTRFYAYATEEVGKGFVRESDDSFEASFPHLPKNTTEMKGTRLYTEAIYPVTMGDDGKYNMHAWAGCPEATDVLFTGTIAQMDSGLTEGLYDACKACDFRPSSMGKVAAASTSIENGFEYHYEAVAKAAEDYEKARSELDPLTAKVKQQAGGLLDQIKQAIGAAINKRIDAFPPGSLGAVALVVNMGSDAPSKGFESSFVKITGMLETRAAVSSATLLEEPANEGANIISSLLDGIAGDKGVATGALGIVLDCWSGMLMAYAGGQKVLENTISAALDSLPLMGASGLGTWAAGALSDVVSTVGLKPANLDALKPVLVNSAHVTRADTSAFSAQLLLLKKQAITNPLASNNLFSSVIASVGDSIVGTLQSSNGKVEIATITLYEGGPSLTIEISLPSAINDATPGVVQDIANGIKAVYAQVTGVKVWE